MIFLLKCKSVCLLYVWLVLNKIFILTTHVFFHMFWNSYFNCSTIELILVWRCPISWLQVLVWNLDFLDHANSISSQSWSGLLFFNSAFWNSWFTLSSIGDQIPVNGDKSFDFGGSWSTFKSLKYSYTSGGSQMNQNLLKRSLNHFQNGRTVRGIILLLPSWWILFLSYQWCCGDHSLMGGLPYSSSWTKSIRGQKNE